MRIVRLAALLLIAVPAVAQKPAKGGEQAWIARSNTYTQKLLDIQAKYEPEEASRQGLSKYDTKAGDFTLASERNRRKEEEAAVAKLIQAQGSEKDPNVLQDLSILIHSEQLGFKREDYEQNHKMRYFNATAIIYRGMASLLDDQVAPGRRRASMERLDRYIGIDPDPAGNKNMTESPSLARSTAPMMDPGRMNGVEMGSPIYSQLIYRMQQQAAKPNMNWPSRQEVETQLRRNGALMQGLEDLLKKYKISGWEAPYAVLQRHMVYYDNWILQNFLPHCNSDFRLPPEEYALNFEDYGIDLQPGQIADMAHKAFADYQAQMGPIAADIAKEHGWKSSDYRDVIAELKKQQLVGDAILPFYENRLHDIEKVIADQHLVTLPGRAAIIRLGTPAESAQQPAPHMVPPPFVHNTGERGVFVLPLNMPAGPGESTAAKVDDYTFDAASWTLIAHEARPGHELQFDSMVEHGVSLARALYAFNSTNAEGWGLYSEYIMFPYMPKEGQLISLQFRLLRAARAFIDPELQSGKLKPKEAMDVLTHEVCVSTPFANQEVERYTFRAPGQANSYFYGFTRLLDLRKETEAALGPKFNALSFHDFILAQGLLPPDLMKKAVEDNFIPQEKGK